MGLREFISQIEKHKALLKRNIAVSVIVGYLKLLLFLLIAISLFYLLFKKFSSAALILCLIEGLAFASLVTYHDKIRGRVRHSNEMIAVNKKHLETISRMLTCLKDTEIESLDLEYPHSGGGVIKHDGKRYGVPAPPIEPDPAPHNFTEYLAANSAQATKTKKGEEPLFTRSGALRFLLM